MIVMNRQQLSRRGLMFGGAALGASLLIGCGPSADRSPPSKQTASGMDAAAGSQTLKMAIYRDPSCGCCEAWAEIARKAGYEVTVIDDPDMAVVKQRLGVPSQLASCHTAVLGDYVVEGHVPLEEVARLLRERPSDIKGIAVPGMPIGSPGMEVPDGTREPFQVIAFDAVGNTSVYKA
jgi:hypothetical protein